MQSEKSWTPWIIFHCLTGTTGPTNIVSMHNLFFLVWISAKLMNMLHLVYLILIQLSIWHWLTDIDDDIHFEILIRAAHHSETAWSLPPLLTINMTHHFEFIWFGCTTEWCHSIHRWVSDIKVTVYPFFNLFSPPNWSFTGIISSSIIKSLSTTVFLVAQCCAF